MTKEQKIKGERWLDIGQGWCLRYEYTDTWLDFWAYEVIGVEMSPVEGRRWFRKKGKRSGNETDETDDIEKAGPEITGFVKWDGCSEMALGRPHFCGAADVEQRARVIVECHKLALLIPHIHYDTAGYEEPTEKTEMLEARARMHRIDPALARMEESDVR